MNALKELSAVKIKATGEVGVIVTVDDSNDDENPDENLERQLSYKVAAAETRWYNHDEVELYYFAPDSPVTR